MSIFKRGKHAKDEAPGSSYGSGAIPVSEEREPVELSAESIQRIAEGVGHHVTFTHEDVQNWPEYKEWRDSLKDNVTLSVDLSGGDLLEDRTLRDEDGNAYRHWIEGGDSAISPFEVELDLVLGEIRALLLEKNASYGDSALNPVRIMSDADAAEQIRIRMDDKLSRLYRGFAFEDTETGNPEDTLKDLVGYYFLLKIAEARHA